jgi:hypothetical protein
MFEITTANSVTFVDLAGPLLALALVAVVALALKPLLLGLVRAAILVIKPRQSNEQRRAGRTLFSMLTLNRMANEADDSDPSFAAELRTLAARA